MYHDWDEAHELSASATSGLLTRNPIIFQAPRRQTHLLAKVKTRQGI